jgi:YidC/Oxa1 family membrane protein insertase
MEPSSNTRVIVTVLLSIAILAGFHFFYEVPRQQRLHEIQAQESSQVAPGTKSDAPDAQVSAIPETAVQPRETLLAAGQRLKIDNPRLTGSVSATGLRFDDLTFNDYYTDLSHSAKVDLLSPSGSASPYYAGFGWVSNDPAVKLPDHTTPWKTTDSALSPDHPVTFTWDNGQGLTFERTIALDANYMFTITSRVINHGAAALTLYNYASVTRQGTPTPGGTGLEGAIAMANGRLASLGYVKLGKGTAASYDSTGGWAGFSDKYWLVAAIPDQQETIAISFRHSKDDNLDLYQTDYRSTAETLAPGATLENTSRLFAGAKEVHLLAAYRDNLGIPKFDLAVDWGWLRFLTKPFFYGIDYLYHLIGVFGLAILAFTVVVRIVIFPLAYKTYREMSRMKDLAPQMAELKEKHKDDKVAMQADVMALYQKEKVNPLSGCVPTIIQIPIFLSLYKVLSVTIEMRQVPFYGWIHDLSAADPTNLFNLFGLIPYTLPLVPHLGAWPLILGTTMFLLQKSQPQPPDPVQAKMMMITPLIFMFIMAKLPAGLVIYYSWSNLISIAQQAAIRRYYHKKYGAKIPAED